MSTNVEPQPFASRAEALEAVASEAVRTCHVYGVPDVSKAAESIRALYAAVAPVGKKHPQRASFAGLFGGQLDVLAAANTVPLHGGLDREALRAVFEFGLGLVPIFVAARAAYPRVRAAATRAQESLSARKLTDEEASNLRTRVLTQTQSSALDAAREHPYLLGDIAALRDATEKLGVGVVTDPTHPTWGRPLIQVRRRRNGSTDAPVTTLDPETRARLDDQMAAYLPKHRKSLVQRARRFAHAVTDAEDVVQHATLHIYSQGVLRSESEWLRVIRGQLAHSWADLQREGGGAWRFVPASFEGAPVPDPARDDDACDRRQDATHALARVALSAEKAATDEATLPLRRLAYVLLRDEITTMLAPTQATATTRPNGFPTTAGTLSNDAEASGRAVEVPADFSDARQAAADEQLAELDLLASEPGELLARITARLETSGIDRRHARAVVRAVLCDLRRGRAGTDR